MVARDQDQQSRFSRATPQNPERAQGDGVEPQYEKVASEEQLVEAVQKSQPLHALLLHLVLSLQVGVDGSKLEPDFF